MNKKILSLVYLVAYDYYINNLKQREIANKYQINRVQVSRYLTEAKNAGLVKIEVHNPFEDKTQVLEEAILSCFPVKRVELAITHESNREHTLQALAEKAKEYINQNFGNFDKVGIGWGTTLFQMAKNFQADRKLPNVEVVSLVGSSFEFDKEFQSNNISFMLADKLGAKHIPFLAPFCEADGKKFKTLLNSSNVSMVMDEWKKLSKVIIGIGCNFSKTPLLKFNVLTEKNLTLLLNFKQVGDILTHYFNIDGEFCKLDINDNLFSCSPSLLANINEVIAVAGGFEKRDSIVGALNTGLIDTIILDTLTAQKIVKI